MTSEQTRSGWERHAQTVAAALIIGLMGWVGISLQELTSQMARFDEKLTASQNLAASRDATLRRHEEALQDVLIRIDRLEREE